MATGDIRSLKEVSGPIFEEITKVQATIAEIETGTEASKLVAPDQLAGSVRGRRIYIQTSEPGSPVTGDLWINTT